jgi:hypothetical protein
MTRRTSTNCPSISKNSFPFLSINEIPSRPLGCHWLGTPCQCLVLANTESHSQVYLSIHNTVSPAPLRSTETVAPVHRLNMIAIVAKPRCVAVRRCSNAAIQCIVSMSPHASLRHDYGLVALSCSIVNGYSYLFVQF